jgi:hypothetical protein
MCYLELGEQKHITCAFFPREQKSNGILIKGAFLCLWQQCFKVNP